MLTFRIYKEPALPPIPRGNSMYLIASSERPEHVEIYVTSSAGVLRRVMSFVDVQEMIDAAIADVEASPVPIVADIDARDALVLDEDTLILVKDATGDVSVSSGPAFYAWDMAEEEFLKITQTVGTTEGTIAAGDDSRFGTLSPGIYENPAIVIDGGLL